MDDPAAWQPYFKGPSWDRWKACIAAIFGLPMTERQQELYREHTHRQRLPSKPFRRAALVVGRRGGKSRVLSAVAVYLAGYVDYSPYIAPGELPTVAIICADKKQAQRLLKYCRGLLREDQILADEIEREDAEIIILKSGVAIECVAATIASPRGKTLIAVLADELAHWRTDNGARNPDTEVLAGAAPGLATIPGSMLLMASSPYAKQGALWNAFRNHYGREDAPVLVWRGSTMEMNSALDPAEEELAYAEDPIAAAAEWGAEFRGDLANYVSVEALATVTRIGRTEMAPSRANRYVAFVDPASGGGDSFTMAIAFVTRSGVGVLALLREKQPPFSPSNVVAEFAAIMKHYGIFRATADRWGGDFVVEAFKAHGITIEHSEKSKSELYGELLPLINSGQIELLDHDRLIGQLAGLQRRTARGGRDSIDHAKGAHDDCANAAAGALVAVAGKRDALAIWRLLAEASHGPLPPPQSTTTTGAEEQQRESALDVYMRTRNQLGNVSLGVTSFRRK